MLESFPVCLAVGSVLGFLSGLGIGGGSLLILWLTLVVGVDSITARGMNLLFFLPAAIIAGLIRWKQGAVDLKKILPAMLGGGISAALFAFLGRNSDVEMMKKAFGALLLVTGLREILYRKKSKDSP